MNKNKPLVSIIMPAFNAAETIEEAICSILNQTYGNLEIICLDDCSDDGTVDVVRKILEPRITLIKSETHRGYIALLNDGIRLAKGEFIARMDADDISSRNRIEAQLQYLNQNPDVGLVGALVARFGDIQDVPALPIDKVACKMWLICYPPIYHPTFMMRRKVIDEGYRYDEKYYYAEDYKFLLDVSKSWEIANVNEVMLQYRVHNKQVSNVKREEQLSVMRKIQYEAARVKLKMHLSESQRVAHALILSGERIGDVRKDDIMAHIDYLIKANERSQYVDAVVFRSWINEVLKASINKLISRSFLDRNNTLRDAMRIYLEYIEFVVGYAAHRRVAKQIAKRIISIDLS